MLPLTLNQSTWPLYTTPVCNLGHDLRHVLCPVFGTNKNIYMTQGLQGNIQLGQIV